MSSSGSNLYSDAAFAYLLASDASQLAAYLVVAEMAAVVAFLVVLVMVVSSGSQAAPCSPQFPLNCVSYVLDGREVPLKMCCIELQNNFKLVQPKASLNHYCEAIKGVQLYNGPLSGAELDLALDLPNKCQLSGQYKKGQKCGDKLFNGGSQTHPGRADSATRASHFASSTNQQSS